MSDSFTRLVPITNQDILNLSSGEVTDISDLLGNLDKPIPTKLSKYEQDLNRNTIFSKALFGYESRGKFDKSGYGHTYGHIKLNFPYINVLGINDGAVLGKILSISSKELKKLVCGESVLIVPLSTNIFERILKTGKNVVKTPIEEKLKNYVYPYSIRKVGDKNYLGYLLTLKTDDQEDTLSLLKTTYGSLDRDIVLSGAYAVGFLLSFITVETVKNQLNALLMKDHSEVERNKLSKRVKYVENAFNYGNLLDYILYTYPVIPLKYRDYRVDGDLGDKLDIMNIIPHRLMLLSFGLRDTNLQIPDVSLIYQLNEEIRQLDNEGTPIQTIFTKVRSKVSKYMSFFLSSDFLGTIKRAQEILQKYIYSEIVEDGEVVKDPKKKSTLTRLSKKTGILRDGVMEIRVDYSGRSVIFSNPELELDYISLPYDIVRKWFNDLLLETIKVECNSLVSNMSNSQLNLIISNYRPKHINQNNHNPSLDKIHQVIRNTLDEVSKKVGVISIRYPSLHRWNVLGSKFIVDYDNKAIGLHPLIVSSYNADFDGDQKAEILIQTEEGVKELEAIMLPSKNLYDAKGSPRHTPSQECITGLYVATLIEDMNALNSPIKDYINITHLHHDYELGNINITDIVRVISLNKVSSVGRFLLQDLIPESIDLDSIIGKQKGLTKKGVSILLSDIIELNIEDSLAVRNYHDKIKDFGYNSITRYGLSISLSDLQEPPTKEQLVKDYEQDFLNIAKDDSLSDIVKYNKQIERGMEFSQTMLDEVKRTLAPDNPIKLLIESGSRGSWTGAVQLLGARGVMEDPNGEYIPKAVTTNFSSGISLDNGIIGSYGGANGSVSKNLLTAITGALARVLVYALNNMNIVQGDCGDTQGTIITPNIHPLPDNITRDYKGNLLIKEGNKWIKLFSFDITDIFDTPDTYLSSDGDIIHNNISIYNVYLNKVLDSKNFSSDILSQVKSAILSVNESKLYSGTAHNGYVVTEYTSMNNFKISDKDGNEVLHYKRGYFPRDFLGRIVCQDILDENNNILFKNGDYISHNFNEEILAKALSHNYLNGVIMRSPLSCKSNNGVCAKCFGLSYTDSPKTIVPVGTAIGMLVAHITGERFTQTSMQVFHTGGTALGGSTKSLFDNSKKLIEDKIIISNELTEKLKVKGSYFQEDYTTFKQQVEQNYQDLYREHKAIPSGTPINMDYTSLGILNQGVYVEATKKYLETIKELFLSGDLYLESIYFECIIKQMFSIVNIIDPSSSNELHKGTNTTFHTFLQENRNLVQNNQLPALAVFVITPISKLSNAEGTDNTLLKMTFQRLKENLTNNIGNYGLVDSPYDTNNISPIIYGKKFPIGKNLRKILNKQYVEIQQDRVKQEVIIKPEVSLAEKEVRKVVSEYNNLITQPSPEPQPIIQQPEPQQPEVKPENTQTSDLGLNTNTLFGSN